MTPSPKLRLPSTHIRAGDGYGWLKLFITVMNGVVHHEEASNEAKAAC